MSIKAVLQWALRHHEDKEDAVKEFRRCAVEVLTAKAGQETGRRYALEMAASECQLLGIDPGTIEPDAADLAKIDAGRVQAPSQADQ